MASLAQGRAQGERLVPQGGLQSKVIGSLGFVCGQKRKDVLCRIHFDAMGRAQGPAAARSRPSEIGFPRARVSLIPAAS
ncbi:MAG: hypothetical protein M1815_002997 [Lichina confinis]|nr:MAG: hypothetical protein M1815_002997 [Lichina confinis]